MNVQRAIMRIAFLCCSGCTLHAQAAYLDILRTQSEGEGEVSIHDPSGSLIRHERYADMDARTISKRVEAVENGVPPETWTASGTAESIASVSLDSANDSFQLNAYTAAHAMLIAEYNAYPQVSAFAVSEAWVEFGFSGAVGNLHVVGQAFQMARGGSYRIIDLVSGQEITLQPLPQETHDAFPFVCVLNSERTYRAWVGAASAGPIDDSAGTTLDLHVVPEPTCLMTLAGMALTLLMRNRRRRQPKTALPMRL